MLMPSTDTWMLSRGMPVRPDPRADRPLARAVPDLLRGLGGHRLAGQRQRRAGCLRLHTDPGRDIGADLVAAAGHTIQQVKQASVQGLSYRDGVLQISLDITDLQILDQLKGQLSGQTGLGVEIQGATAQDGRVRARLRIRGGGS